MTNEGGWVGYSIKNWGRGLGCFCNNLTNGAYMEKGVADQRTSESGIEFGF